MTDPVSLPLGVIEGFFGRPWGDAARGAYAQFLRARGFSYYIYAPKADRNLRKCWRDPMPAEQLATLMALATRYRACGLRFGMGLTPYELHLDYSDASRRALRGKIDQLNQISVDILCVLFDDMHGAVPHLAQLQARIVADISNWTRATSLIVCPTYYSDDPVLSRVFGPAPANYLEALGRMLDPAIGIFWTGQKVCSSGYPDQHLGEVTQRLRRQPMIWDNHIANDARERCSHLYLDPFADGWSVNPKLVAGLAINPMNQPLLSRLPLAACARRLSGAHSSGEGSLASLAREICGERLGAELVAALDLIQARGLGAIDTATRATLIARFLRHGPEACATEIIDWLNGGYQFDPLCLTD